MPYLLLTLTSTVLLLYTFTRPRIHTGLVAAAVSLGSSLALSDLLVSVVWKLYIFHPGLLPGGRDLVLGAFLADFLFVPFLLASLAVLFPKHPVGVWFVALVVVEGVEILFLRAGLLTYDGWRLWYSAALFGARFALELWWIAHFRQVGYTPWYRYLLITTSLTYIWWVVYVVTCSLLSLWAMRLHLLPDPTSDKVLGMFLLSGLPLYVVGLALIWLRRAGSLLHLGVTGAAWAGYLYVLEGLGIWVGRPGWSPLYQAALAMCVIWASGRLDAWWAGERPAAAKVR
ncbi:MAG TPA: hypothetical protein VNT75_18790 [Symbiobacteriaceae bacterium]|nr:hypothetical protein [Symbiobacteriaceae bacterium]